MNTSPNNDTTFIVVFLPVKAGAREEYKSSLIEMGRHIAKEPLFVRAVIHEDRNDPDTLVLYEEWNALPEDLMKQIDRPYRLEYEAAVGHLLKAEKSVTFLSAPFATFP